MSGNMYAEQDFNMKQEILESSCYSDDDHLNGNLLPNLKMEKSALDSSVEKQNISPGLDMDFDSSYKTKIERLDTFLLETTNDRKNINYLENTADIDRASYQHSENKFDAMFSPKAKERLPSEWPKGLFHSCLENEESINLFRSADALSAPTVTTEQLNEWNENSSENLFIKCLQSNSLTECTKISDHSQYDDLSLSEDFPDQGNRFHYFSNCHKQNSESQSSNLFLLASQTEASTNVTPESWKFKCQSYSAPWLSNGEKTSLNLREASKSKCDVNLTETEKEQEVWKQTAVADEEKKHLENSNTGSKLTSKILKPFKPIFKRSTKNSDTPVIQAPQRKNSEEAQKNSIQFSTLASTTKCAAVFNGKVTCKNLIAKNDTDLSSKNKENLKPKCALKSIDHKINPSQLGLPLRKKVAVEEQRKEEQSVTSDLATVADSCIVPQSSTKNLEKQALKRKVKEKYEGLKKSKPSDVQSEKVTVLQTCIRHFKEKYPQFYSQKLHGGDINDSCNFSSHKVALLKTVANSKREKHSSHTYNAAIAHKKTVGMIHSISYTKDGNNNNNNKLLEIDLLEVKAETQQLFPTDGTEIEAGDLSNKVSDADSPKELVASNLESTVEKVTINPVNPVKLNDKAEFPVDSEAYDLVRNADSSDHESFRSVRAAASTATGFYLQSNPLAPSVPNHDSGMQKTPYMPGIEVYMKNDEYSADSSTNSSHCTSSHSSDKGFPDSSSKVNHQHVLGRGVTRAKPGSSKPVEKRFASRKKPAEKCWMKMNVVKNSSEQKMVHRKLKSSNEKRVVEQDKVTLSKRHLLDLLNKTTFPVWVQCDKCKKWRCLRNTFDPSVLPKVWTCLLNEDSKFNSCSLPEEEYSQEEHDRTFAFTTFTLGSVVWVTSASWGPHWWPAMVDDDPDTETFFWLPSHSNEPNYYHVTFFGQPVSRAWVKTKELVPFHLVKQSQRKLENTNRSLRALEDAVAEAKKAADLPLNDRRHQFCFAARYNGPWLRSE